MTRTWSDVLWSAVGGFLVFGGAAYVLVKVDDWRATRLDRAAREAADTTNGYEQPNAPFTGLRLSYGELASQLRLYTRKKTNDMGTITNGITTKPYENSNAPGLDWRKSSRTDLDPILKDCVILAEAPDAKDHPHPHVPDGTRMIALADDKDADGPVLYFTRAEITKFIEGAKAGEFDEFLATDEELAAAAEEAIAA